jgi:hypothetical protein
MPLLIRIAIRRAVPACSTQWIAPAQGKATIRIATQSPLSEPVPRGQGIRLGAQLAIEQLERPLGPVPELISVPSAPRACAAAGRKGRAQPRGVSAPAACHLDTPGGP